MLIVTYINLNRVSFALAWVQHLEAEKQPHHLVAALDQKALVALERRGVACYLLNSTLSESETGWGTHAFRQLGLFKVQMVLDLARTGVDTLTVDADAFILRDPLPYVRGLVVVLERRVSSIAACRLLAHAVTTTLLAPCPRSQFRSLPQADVLMSSDHLAATNGYNDTGLEDERAFGSAFNIGFIFIRARAVEFVEAWRDACWSHEGSWDQELFAQVLRRGGSRRGATEREDRLQPMFRLEGGRQLLAGVLPVSLFASGHTFFVTRMSHLMRTHPYMVHTTFQYGGAPGKKHRLREAMIWEDEPAYYEARMLRYEPDLPRELVYPRGAVPDEQGTVEPWAHMSVAEHFELVNHQLRQLRNALALARRLHRVLILPRLVCGLDRWWAPHSGTIPGSGTRLPLLECPADHILDFERMRSPETLLREHTVLCNPRMPAKLLAQGLRHEKLPSLPTHHEASSSGTDDGLSSDSHVRLSHLLYGTSATAFGDASPTTRRATVARLLSKLATAHEDTAILEVSATVETQSSLQRVVL